MNAILDFLQKVTEFQLGWADLVDILLVTLLIYTLLMLLRGSRAMQMLWGILVLLGIYVLAGSFGLMTLTSILSHSVSARSRTTRAC